MFAILRSRENKNVETTSFCALFFKRYVTFVLNVGIGAYHCVFFINCRASIAFIGKVTVKKVSGSFHHFGKTMKATFIL